MNLTRQQQQKGQKKQSGVALVMVLWLLIVLSIIGLALSVQTRAGIQLTTHHLAETKARLAAEAGIEHAVWKLLNSNTLPAQQNYSVDYNGAKLDIAISDEGGKIDLNRGHLHLLEGLLRQHSDGDGEALLDAILDWRDADSETRPDGAEDDYYITSGNAYGARDADFASVAELQQVRGITPKIYRQLAPHLTVYTTQTGINPAAASAEVLKSVPGLNADDIESFMQQRELDPLINLPVAQAYGGNQNGQLWSITSTANTGQASHSMRTVIQLGNPGQQAWLVLARFEYLPVEQQQATGEYQDGTP